MILISACLAGRNVKYNGGNNEVPWLCRWIERHKEQVLLVCPEVMGGLPTPRTPAEIVNGEVINREGVSVDAKFREGASRALEKARQEKPDLIILQSRSPSCGVKEIYDGTFSGRLVSGHGIFAGLAQENGFPVMDVEDCLSSRREKL